MLVGLEVTKNHIKILLQRPEQQNALNMQLLKELHAVLDKAESHPANLIIIKGSHDFFCSGMDLQEVASYNDRVQFKEWATLYAQLLKRLTLIPKIVLALVEGKAIAGGIGLAAAADYVIAAQTATFKLSEAIFGLVPGILTPYLIRKVGFHPAYSMALTTRTLSAAEAHAIHLVDQICDDPTELIENWSYRANRLTHSAIQEIKTYFKSFDGITDEVEKTAIDKLVSLFPFRFKSTDEHR